jgi:anion-transporting  ArsA/GET3 family ATPase
VSPRLHVLLGAGGVGKTTLAAAYALSLAREGRRVGLLGIDPARRLQTALGVALADAERPVPDAGLLRAAMLSPAECLPRWAAESARENDARERLLANAFFVALAERLATANDVFAAIRMVEWAEHDRALEHLVVDTAPGLNAIEFLRRPEALSAFLEGSLVGWLRQLARTRRHGGAVAGVAQRVVSALSRLGGSTMILELADFLAAAEGVLERMATRLSEARRWIAEPATEILLVAAVRDDAAQVARTIASSLAVLGLAPRTTIVNRALDPALASELDVTCLRDGASHALDAMPPYAARVLRLAHDQGEAQASVCDDLAPLAGPPIVLPAVTGLDAPRGAGRRAPLAALGDRLRHALEARG